MRVVFEEFAREESGHKVRLESIKQGGAFCSAGKIIDLKIADYTVDVEVGPDMNYQDAIVLAMQREKAAFKLYSDLAWLADDPELKDMFILLAQEEARHKLRFEIEFDEVVLKEN
jgi:rubrerythrin